MKDIFDKISSALINELKGQEEISINLIGEDQTYLRYNAGKIRQNTHVIQNDITLTYRNLNKSLVTNWSLSISNEADLAISQALKHLQQARKASNQLPDSLHSPRIENNGSSVNDFRGQIPAPIELMNRISGTVDKMDFCGFVAVGPQVYASQNSKGQSHWFSRESFFVDFSIYNGEHAVKAVYSDLNWNAAIFQNKIADSLARLKLMDRPIQKPQPGAYRVFLEPAAVLELVQYLGWYSFSQKSFRTGQGCFGELARQKRSLSPHLTIRENFELAFAPIFNSLGEVSQALVPLVEMGRFKQFLTSSRSAEEFNLATNHASEAETPRSLEILPGHLKRDAILKSLGTGIYIGNLHYVNASDQKSARLTGMTRFGCFWVEGGEIVGPIENLRFDESLYDAWGANLLDLTETSEVLPEVGTYGARALGGYKLPGMLIENFHFTL